MECPDFKRDTLSSDFSPKFGHKKTEPSDSIQDLLTRARELTSIPKAPKRTYRGQSPQDLKKGLPQREIICDNLACGKKDVMWGDHKVYPVGWYYTWTQNNGSYITIRTCSSDCLKEVLK